MNFVICRNGDSMPVDFMPKIKTGDKILALSSAVLLSRWFEHDDSIMKVIKHFVWSLMGDIDSDCLSPCVRERMSEIEIGKFVPDADKNDVLDNFDFIADTLQNILEEDYMQAYTDHDVVFLFVPDAFPKENVQTASEAFMQTPLAKGRYLFIHAGLPKKKLLDHIRSLDWDMRRPSSGKIDSDEISSEPDGALWMLGKVRQVKIPFPLKADSDSNSDSLSAAAWLVNFGESGSRGCSAAVELVNALISDIDRDSLDTHTVDWIKSIDLVAKPVTQKRIKLLKKRVQNAMNHRYFRVKVSDTKVVVDDPSKWDTEEMHKVCKKTFPYHEIVLQQ